MSNTLPTVKVTARIADQQGKPVHRAVVTMRLTTTERCMGYVVPREVRAETGPDGTAVLKVWPNELGTESSEYQVTILFPEQCAVNGAHPGHLPPLRSIRGHATVPDSDCNLQDIMELPPYEQRGAGQVITSEVAAFAAAAGRYADAAHTSLSAAQSVETRLNATADGTAAARGAAEEAANQAKASEKRAAELVDGVADDICHFRNSVVDEVDRTAKRLTAEATTCISQHKASALDSLDLRAGEAMSETTEAITKARGESVQAVKNASQEAVGEIAAAGQAELESLRDEAALFGEDFENLTERALAAAKRAGCSSASAQSAAIKACECATRAEGAAQGMERLRDEALSAVEKVKTSAECASADAIRVEAAAGSVEANTLKAVDSATEAKKHSQAASVSAQAAAESAAAAHDAQTATAEHADRVAAATGDMEAAITEAAGNIVSEDVVNAAVAQATATATNAAAEASNAATTAGEAATHAAADAEKAQTAMERSEEISGLMRHDYNVEQSVLRLAAGMIRLSDQTTRMEIDGLLTATADTQGAAQMIRLADRVTHLELINAKIPSPSRNQETAQEQS